MPPETMHHVEARSNIEHGVEARRSIQGVEAKPLVGFVTLSVLRFGVMCIQQLPLQPSAPSSTLMLRAAGASVCHGAVTARRAANPQGSLQCGFAGL